MDLAHFLHNVLGGAAGAVATVGNGVNNVDENIKTLANLLTGYRAAPSVTDNFQRLTPQQRAAFTPYHPEGGAPQVTLGQIAAASQQPRPSGVQILAALHQSMSPMGHSLGMVANPYNIQGGLPTYPQGNDTQMQGSGLPYSTGVAPQGNFASRLFPSNFNIPGRF